MKLYFYILLGLTLSINTNAQVEESKVITLTAKLNSTVVFEMENNSVVFDFSNLNDYQQGIGGSNSNYQTQGSISSTTNWQLCFNADRDLETIDGKNTLPLDNIGISAKFTGSNEIENKTIVRPMALSQDRRNILTQSKSASNSGDKNANSFTIYWEMGTQKEGLNQKSILDQKIERATYSTDVQFAVVEKL